jgi:hypothetical protein
VLVVVPAHFSGGWYVGGVGVWAGGSAPCVGGAAPFTQPPPDPAS